MVRSGSATVIEPRGMNVSAGVGRKCRPAAIAWRIGPLQRACGSERAAVVERAREQNGRLRRARRPQHVNPASRHSHARRHFASEPRGAGCIVDTGRRGKRAPGVLAHRDEHICARFAAGSPRDGDGIAVGGNRWRGVRCVRDAECDDVHRRLSRSPEGLRHMGVWQRHLRVWRRRCDEHRNDYELASHGVTFRTTHGRRAAAGAGRRPQSEYRRPAAASCPCRTCCWESESSYGSTR
jgi:hypothetical protein